MKTQDKKHHSIPDSDWISHSREEKAAFGKALRTKVPRSSHSGWMPVHERPDPVDILIASSEGRLEQLIPIRYGRMLQSPFSFYRGAASIMACDLSVTPSTGLYVQTCGDCHLLNFGSHGTPERRIIFDINDFDETLPAPWEWDLKRLAASFAIATVNNKLSTAQARNSARECVKSYQQRITEYAAMNPLDIWYSYISADDILRLSKNDETNKRYRRQIDKASGKGDHYIDFPKLTEVKDGQTVIKDNPPLIFHFNGLDFGAERDVFDRALELYYRSMGAEKRTLLHNYHFRDLAAKVVGVGSVGTRCGITLRMSPDGDPLFLQIKEARKSVLEPYAGKSGFENCGERVVVGQKLIQAATDIFLGWTQMDDGRQFYIRQLRNMKIKPLVEIFDAATMEGYARLCGWALARAHAKSGSSSIISGYIGQSDVFAEALADFAMDYGEQNRRDFEALKKAARKGRIDVYFE